MRAPGMTLHKMPLFVWSMLVTAFLLLLAIPVLAGAITALARAQPARIAAFVQSIAMTPSRSAVRASWPLPTAVD